MDKNVYAAIQSQYATFSKVGKRIADHIIADPVHITSISIQQMAAELGIAESSIIRFCKILGCAGFSEMKLLLAKYSPKSVRTIFEDLSETDSIQTISESVFGRNIDTLERALQLLDFQKMENGALQLNLVSCDIKEIVNDVYSQFTSPAELKGIELVLTLPEQELVSMVDREKLSKILVNLMGNAIKYARTRIDLKLVTTDAGYEIYVSDDGRGVPDAQKGKIFEAFYQMPDDKVATATGTGIGLAFAKSLAEAHQGSLRLEDNEPQGSSFILSLPLNEKKAEEAADIVEVHSENEGSAENIPSEFSGKKFTVLLVEDNVELLNLTRDLRYSNRRV